MALQITTQENLTPKEILNKLDTGIKKIENFNLGDINSMIKEDVSVEIYTEAYNLYEKFFNKTGPELISKLRELEDISSDLEKSFQSIAKRYNTLKIKFNELISPEEYKEMKENYETVMKYTSIIEKLNYTIKELTKKEKYSYEDYHNKYAEIKEKLEEINSIIKDKDFGEFTTKYKECKDNFNKIEKKPIQTEYTRINTTRKASTWFDVSLRRRQIATIEVKSFIGVGTDGTEYYTVSVPGMEDSDVTKKTNFVLRRKPNPGVFDSEIGLFETNETNADNLILDIEQAEYENNFRDIEIENSAGWGQAIGGATAGAGTGAAAGVAAGTIGGPFSGITIPGGSTVGTIVGGVVGGISGATMDEDLNDGDVPRLDKKLKNVKSWYKAPKEK